MKWVLLAATLAIAGCTAMGPTTWIGRGQSEFWHEDVFLDGPLVIEAGARLQSDHLIATPGPILVYGEFASLGTIRFTGTPGEGVIRLLGGKATIEGALVEDLTAITIEDGEFVLAETLLPLYELRAASAKIRMSNSSLSAGTSELHLFFHDTQLSTLNTTFGNVQIDTSLASDLRLINAGVPVNRFSGFGHVAQGWTTLIRPHGIGGVPFPNEAILITDVGSNDAGIEAQTGLDGRAYVEVIDFHTFGGQHDPRPIHAVQVPAHHGIATFVTRGPDEEVDVLVAG